ncbi:carboxymuconolactone decarboxylase family protein [Dyella japonica]|uniref:Alkylhydroperoxidase n=1 Tax=Dyella japonica A8 TaxID=1217721 RepID=A0A075K7R4_9GAMM|nr:carboxymuconolactone decarboxylase family protein [Dyella japonica]AIF48178.1 alkylhydroperoxidase [Dyella japonica A8]
MTQRIDYLQQSPDLLKKLVAFSTAANQASIEKSICHLVEIRASQINGCSFCLDMHIKQAVIDGERPLRLFHLPAWRESTLFSHRERAALAWTEALTHLSSDGVPDSVYDRVRDQFSEQELIDLTYVVMGINAWNRINIAFRCVPGALDTAYGLNKSGLA